MSAVSAPPATSETPAPTPGEGHAGPFDWMVFCLIVLVGGSSFAMIRVAVETAPPNLVASGRLWIGAAFLYVVMRQAGRRFPPLLRTRAEGGGLSPEWIWMAGLGAVGYAAPFMIFPWAQQYIPSGLAGVYMAFMPVWTIGLAYLFAGESLGLGKAAGVVLGVAGVVILVGPETARGVFDADLAAQLSLLAATFFYAVGAVWTRRAPKIRPRVFSAGTMLCAAIAATPALFFIEWRVEDWTAASVAGIVGLGLGPTGLGALLLIIIIQRVGAGFMSFVNYLVPICALLIGAAAFSEPVTARVVIALGLVLVGVAASQWESARRARAAASGAARATSAVAD